LAADLIAVALTEVGATPAEPAESGQWVNAGTSMAECDACGLSALCSRADHRSRKTTAGQPDDTP
jgi:hypothetical protein